MPEGNRKITLIQPGEVLGQGTHGDLQRDNPVEHTAWAVRRDRGGRDAVEEDIELARWSSSFEIRWLPRFAAITPEWSVVDDVGRRYQIIWVREHERRFLTLFCEVAI